MPRTRQKSRQGFSFQKQRALELASIEASLHQPPALVGGLLNAANPTLLYVVFNTDINTLLTPDASRFLIDGVPPERLIAFGNSRVLGLVLASPGSSGEVAVLAGTNVRSSEAQGNVEVAPGTAPYIATFAPPE
jgi:hypothetical protein